MKFSVVIVLSFLVLFGVSADTEINIVSPSSASVYETGSSQIISWSFIGTLPPVTIELWNGDQLANGDSITPIMIINDTLFSDSSIYRSYNWNNVSSTLPTGSHYYITISGQNEAGTFLFGVSSLFSIKNVESSAGGASGSLSFIQPDSTSSVIAFTSYPILWSSEGLVISDYLTLHLYRFLANSTGVPLVQDAGEIASYVLNTGSYTWFVPKNLGDPDYKYYVEMFTSLDPTKAKVKSGFFQILPFQ